jgi:hypothetical protein
LRAILRAVDFPIGEKIMTPRIKFGIIFGVVCLFLNICVSSAVGACGFVPAILAGGLAGFFTAQAEKNATKGDGSRAGVVAGSIAGALVMVGQLIAGVAVLVFIQSTNTKILFGSAPTSSSPISQQIVYYLTGLGVGMCFGVVDVILSALAGAGAGYLGTPQRGTLTTPV